MEHMNTCSLLFVFLSLPGQFLHEIRTLTIEVQKRRDQEAALQSRLDEMSEQIQEKSFELNRKSREESDLRGKRQKKE